jgi:hypothetical protein
MNSRRHALSLAAVLAATVLTGGAAILGLTHASPVAQGSAPAPALVQVQQAPPVQGEEGD